jgi:RNA polymerase sigma-70 factor (family 1)
MNHAEYTDAELVARVRSGEEGAFDLIYKMHWLRLYQVACRITEDDAVAQDIIQDTFVSFWEKGCHKDIISIEGYLYQAVKFRCFMHLRSGSISQRHLERLTRVATSASPEQEYETHEVEELLQRSIDHLPEKCREVFLLSRIQFLPNKMIAEKLHISPKTVENQITKALKHLRLSIEKLTLIFFFFFS